MDLPLRRFSGHTGDWQCFITPTFVHTIHTVLNNGTSRVLLTHDGTHLAGNVDAGKLDGCDSTVRQVAGLQIPRLCHVLNLERSSVHHQLESWQSLCWLYTAQRFIRSKSSWARSNSWHAGTNNKEHELVRLQVCTCSCDSMCHRSRALSHCTQESGSAVICCSGTM